MLYICSKPTSAYSAGLMNCLYSSSAFAYSVAYFSAYLENSTKKDAASCLWSEIISWISCLYKIMLASFLLFGFWDSYIISKTNYSISV